MTQRLKSLSGSGNEEQKSQPHVVDFNQVREQKLQEKKRQTERILFKNLISVFLITATNTMRPVQLIDVSEEGLSFQIPFNPESVGPNTSEHLSVRIYFTTSTFLDLTVNINNSRDSIEDHVRYVRYGCKVEKEIAAYPAYVQFVRFLKLYSELSQTDKGDLSIRYF